MKKAKSDVFVDLEILVGWKNEMETINDSAMQVLNTIKGIIADLENYYIGNSAKGFVNASNRVLDQGKKSHENMKEVSAFLISVANTMGNQ